MPQDVEDDVLMPLQHIASMIEQTKRIPKSDHADNCSLVRSCVKERIKHFGDLSGQEKDDKFYDNPKTNAYKMHVYNLLPFPAKTRKLFRQPARAF